MSIQEDTAHALKSSGERVSTLSEDGNDFWKVVRGKGHNVGIEKESNLDASKSKPSGKYRLHCYVCVYNFISLLNYEFFHVQQTRNQSRKGSV